MERKKELLIGLGIGILIAIGAAFLLFKTGHIEASQSTISGKLDINGVVPDGATITLQQRTFDETSEYSVFHSSIPADDGYVWTFDTAKAGTSYEIQANLVVNGNTISQSSPIQVTAPATDQVLTLNIASSEPDEQSNAVISGNIGVNGYIPQGSTITIEGRLKNQGEFELVASNLTAKDNQFMSYTTAVAGHTYEVRGYMYDISGNEIGSSNTITITAPAMNEELHINSHAAPPTPEPTRPAQPTPTPQPASNISGNIHFNGQAPSNTRIVVFSKPEGSGNYSVAQDNISPKNGMSWKFSADRGKSYNIVAILKQKQANGTDKDIATSNTLTITSPAANETLTINSGFTLPPASGSITVSCGNHNSSDNTWDASVSFESITGAGAYWFQIGTTNGGKEVSNFTQNATNNQNQSFKETFKDGVTYFARYAFSTVSDQDAYSSEFSPFSSTTQLRCAQ